MGRVPQFAMAWLGTMALQQGPLWWGAHHRHHHKFSDLPEDVHSPIQRGLYWAHMGWIFSGEHDETRWSLIQDLAKYPELRWINKYHVIPGALMGLVIFLIGGWPAFVWGFLVSTVFLYHGTFTINSLAHTWGSRRYSTGDTSRNNLFLSLITMGEGWHNNHHCYMSSTNQGFFWWEIDMSYYLLVGLSKLGVVSDLRKPPLELLEAKRLDRDSAALIPSQKSLRRA